MNRKEYFTERLLPLYLNVFFYEKEGKYGTGPLDMREYLGSCFLHGYNSIVCGGKNDIPEFKISDYMDPDLFDEKVVEWIEESIGRKINEIEFTRINIIFSKDDIQSLSESFYKFGLSARDFFKNTNFDEAIKKHKESQKELMRLIIENYRDNIDTLGRMIKFNKKCDFSNIYESINDKKEQNKNKFTI